MRRILLGIGESIHLAAGTKIISVLFSSQTRDLPCELLDSGSQAGLPLSASLLAAPTILYASRRMFLPVGFTALSWLFLGCSWRQATFVAGSRIPPLHAQRTARSRLGVGPSTAACLVPAAAFSALIPTGTCWCCGWLIGGSARAGV